jgi:hypothetical protein
MNLVFHLLCDYHLFKHTFPSVEHLDFTPLFVKKIQTNPITGHSRPLCAGKQEDGKSIRAW